MPHVIVTPDQATPAWLTAVLRRSNVLSAGQVVTVRSAANAAFNSATTHLFLTYSGDAPSSAPRRLLLKRNRPEEWAVRSGAMEVAFYTLIASLPDRLPMIIPCYDAAHDQQSGHSHILLPDLSDTHKPPITRDQQFIPEESVPPAVYIDQVVDALARLHVYWWEHPLLSSSAIVQVGSWCRDWAGYEGHIQRRRGEWDNFIRDEGSWLPADVRALCERALSHWPLLWDRHLVHRLPALANITLTHGDCYFCNFLSPKDPTAGSTYLIDWQSPEAALGAGDLVNMWATFWTPAQRGEERREERILRRYHTMLQENGIDDYSWDDLLTDYKIMVHEWIFVAIWDQTNGSDRNYWWPKLQCLTAAYQDLGCAALLDPY